MGGLHSGALSRARAPDFYIREGQGMDIQGLAEFKFIGCCPTRYPGAAGNTPVNRRAHQFQAEYERKARAVDTPAGVVLARLRSFGRIKGLVVGAYSEFSNESFFFVVGL